MIVGADHVYRMDFQQMVQQHIESGAEFTVAGIRQPISQSNQFGVIEVDPEHPSMIKSFQEKPQTTTGLPDDPYSILASMGNYVANTDACSRLWRSTKRPKTPSMIWVATSLRTSRLAMSRRLRLQFQRDSGSDADRSSTGAMWVL